MNQVFHWQTHDGAWQLARKVKPEFHDDITQMLGPLYVPGERHVLMQPLYDPPGATPVWVPERLLRPYPSEKIEESTR